MNAKEVEIVHTAERTVANSSGDVFISQRYLEISIESIFLQMSLTIVILKILAKKAYFRVKCSTFWPRFSNFVDLSL